MPEALPASFSKAVLAIWIFLTGAGKYQDLTVAGAYGANTTITGFTTQALYVNINTANANGTVDIAVYGDVVSF
jgi:hypothetical protein